MSRYSDVYAQWQREPEGFWLEAAKAIDWYQAPVKAFDKTSGPYGRWFPDATCNTCFNAIDRHVAAGRGPQPALIYDSPLTGTKPKLVMAASCGIEPGRVVHYKPLLDEAIELADYKPAACLIFQRPQETAKLTAGRDYDWAAQATHLAHYDLSHFRSLFLAGERADPDTVNWAEQVLKVPVIDHWWQTETGWCMVGNPLGIEHLPVKHGSPTVPMPGFDVQIVDEAGHPVEAGKMGSIVVKLPLPPGALPSLWQADDRMISSYLEAFPGYYSTSDAGYRDADGYLYIMGRTDDIINVAGHRLSTGGMEEVLSSHPDVAECAVIGIKDALKGEQPCGFIVLKHGANRPHEVIEKEIVKLVRDKIGPVAAFKLVLTVPRLPKTRSGKILRGTMKKIADHDPWNTPATIDDPAILTEISSALKEKGI
eukprot:gene8207-8291_t